jgi:hypothetical protein
MEVLLHFGSEGQRERWPTPPQDLVFPRTQVMLLTVFLLPQSHPTGIAACALALASTGADRRSAGPFRTRTSVSSY